MSAIYGWPVPRPEIVSDVKEAAKWIVGAVAELAITSIILDDYESVATSDEVNELIEAVAEKLPPHVRIIVASETAPGFLKRARLRQMIAELDVSDLRFDADDVARYIREVHKYEITDAAASSIARRSGGCAAIVNLVGQLCHNLPTYLRVDFEAIPLGPSDEHVTVLLREVLSRGGHPPARAARYLVQCLVGLPGGSSPGDALLDFLEERHCLAQGYNTDPPFVAGHRMLAALAERL
ncbi:MAG TPA: hypothetical protein PLF26_05430 [Blastocatellia bacterium]|nr:hypothetical protein [Blastocatellia bacterium]